MKKVAIMQPTYIPWVGYFALMDYVDEFVILDHVQFSRRSWQQRNRIVSSGNEKMLSVSVQKTSRNSSISEIILSDPRKELIKHPLTIKQAYSKCDYFDKYFSGFSACYTGVSQLLPLNMNIILFLKECFGIKTPIVFSSDLNVTGAKSELMFNICSSRNATRYISSPGSKDYMESVKGFDFNLIPVSYFDYRPCRYKQLSDEFIPFMGAIDLLLNQGPASLSILRSGITSPYK
jgi:hypothetical protein